MKRTALSPCGVLRDYQKALAELRTGLDDFTEDESLSLMACGYQMTCWAYEANKDQIGELSDGTVKSPWDFDKHLSLITSTAAKSVRQASLLADLEKGHKVVF